MNRHEKIVLATESYWFFVYYALYISVPVGFVITVKLYRGEALNNQLWIVAAIPAFIFFGPFVSRLRSRALCASKAGISWKVSNDWQFLGGISSWQIDWNCFESCQAIRVESKHYPGYIYDALEVQIQSRCQ